MVKNILYINPTAKMSGAEFSLFSFLEKLDRSRFNPVLLLPEDGLFSQKAKDIGVKVIVLPSLIRFGEGYRISKSFKILKAIYKMRIIIKQKRIHLVHSNSPRAAYIGGIAAKLSSVPSLTHVRDIYLSPFSHPLKARLLNFLSDIIIAVSHATKESIVKSFPSLEPKIKVVYNGIDIEKMDRITFKDIRKEFAIERDSPIIVSVGLIHPAKGHDTLIRASAIVKKSFPAIKVFIIGGIMVEKDRKYKEDLEKLTKELGLEENIIFAGLREDVFNFMQVADVIVHPAIYPEPFPRTILEASALKKTIVATKVGGIPEILEHDVSALLVEPSNPESLAHAILAVLMDKGKAKRLALEARRKVEKSFTIEKHVENMTEIYENLLTGTHDRKSR